MDANARSNILHDLGPLYHNYSFFGVNNEQLPGIFAPNQRAKSPIITAYIAYAIAKSRRDASPISFAELFCADGYYAMVASRLGCDISLGIDSDRDKHLGKAQIIASRLELSNIQFYKAEITATSEFPSVDIVANVGGLYHVTDPEGITAMSYRMARKYLIVQTVVSLANDREDYFESPAPGWTWGSRYSKQSFDAMIRRQCPKIVDYHFNVLEGNSRLEDRGSVYYLIEKT